MTSVIPVRLELGPAENVGANAIVPIQRAIVVTGYQITASIAAPLGLTVGNSPSPLSPAFSEALIYGTFTAEFPKFTQDNTFGVVAPWPQDNALGPCQLTGSANMGSTLASYQFGDLFRAILKTNFPDACTISLCSSGDRMLIPTGSYLTVHIETNEQSSGDVEIQGVIYYE